MAPRFLIPVRLYLRLLAMRGVALLGLGLAIGIGVLARTNGLGELPLAVDEYYYVTSIQLILEHGLPAFPTGGYYFRGPLVQYAIAGLVELLGESSFSLRLPGVVFSLASVLLVYLYAKRFVPRALAAATAAALLLSSWDIEFARFIRMYSGFQAATLLLLLLLHEAYCRGRRSWRYLPHVGVVLATLTHELGVLFAPLLFLPLVPGATSLRLGGLAAQARFALAGLATLVPCIFVFRVISRDLGIGEPYPAGFVPQSHDLLVSASFPFWHFHPDAVVHLALFLSIAAGIGFVLLLLQRCGSGVREEDVLLGLLLWLTLGHLFVLSGVALLVLLARVPFRRWFEQPPRTYLMLGIAGLIAGGWVALALLDPDRLLTPEVRARWDLTEAGRLKVLWTTFFGWPNPYHNVIRPFAVELPVIGLALALALLLSSVHTVRRSLLGFCCHPSFIILYTIAMLGVLSAPESTTRYLFHAYPVILVVIAWAAQQVWEWLAGRWSPTARSAPAAGGTCLFLLLFALSSDFNPGHWWAGHDEAVILRTGSYERFEKTWYWRPDYRSPARFVGERARAGERSRIVLANVPPSSHYLHQPHAVFYPRSSMRFQLVSRKGGTVDLWSNQRLVSTPEELYAYTQDAHEVWIIRETMPSTVLPQPEEVWGERLRGIEQAYLSRDGRIEVLHLQLAPAADSRHRQDQVTPAAMPKSPPARNTHPTGVARSSY